MSALPLIVRAGAVVLIAVTAALVGWLAYLKMEHRAHYGLGSYGETDPDAMTNCRECGARNEAERAECRHCSEPLSSDDRPDSDGRLGRDGTAE